MLIELGVLTAMYLGLVWIMNTKQRTEIHIVSQPALKLRVENSEAEESAYRYSRNTHRSRIEQIRCPSAGLQEITDAVLARTPDEDLREVLRTVLEASIDKRQRMGTRQTGPERLEQQQGDSTPGGPYSCRNHDWAELDQSDEDES
jgi:hypothetical protein